MRAMCRTILVSALAMQAVADVNVREFGAVADGMTDSTAAFQKAIDALGANGGEVYAPAGKYVVGELRLKSGVTVRGVAGYGFREANSGTVLTMRKDDSSRCMFNFTGSTGATVRDLAMIGDADAELAEGQGDKVAVAKTSRRVHGCALLKPDFGTHEDYPLVDHCLVRGFSGDGLHLVRVWCGNVRNCLVLGNEGCGIRLRGWDVFILNNEIATNGEYGFDVTGVNASNTITANRIEWNRLGGMRIHQGRHYCINANYFDRSGTAGLQMTDSENITFTGNQFWRSGRPQWERPTEPYSAHAVIRNCRGITFSSNNMNAGRDDDRKGEYSPRTGLVLEKLTDCVVMGNTAHRAYLEKFIDDRGGHVNTVVRDNVGSPMGEPIVLDVGVDE